MPRLLFSFAALAAIAIAPASSYADGPTRSDARPAPRSYQSPTDEYAPPAYRAPRTQRSQRRAPVARDGSLTAYMRSLPRYGTPPSLGDLAPASGPTYTYLPAPRTSTYYYYAPSAPTLGYTADTPVPPVPPGVFTQQDFDGAPCPTRSRTSLGELFACTR